MKIFFQLSVFLLIAIQTCFAQNTVSSIDEGWLQLKAQLQRRTDIITNLINIASASKKIGKRQLNESRTLAIDLFKYVDTLTVRDSITISVANSKNEKLTQAISKTLDNLGNDSKIKSRSDFMELLIHLEGCTNRLACVKYEYNRICKAFNRTDLLFDSDKAEKTPTVEF